MATIQPTMTAGECHGPFHDERKVRMGAYVPVIAAQADRESKLQFVLGALGVQADTSQIIREATRFTKRRIQGYSYMTLMGMFRVINIVFATEKGTDTKLTNKSGSPKDVLAYVYNLDAPDLSELGSIYFKQYSDGTFRRYA